MLSTRPAAVLLAVLLLCAAAACSSSSKGSTSSGPALASSRSGSSSTGSGLGTGPSSASNAQVKAKLLTGKDLGDAWSVDTSDQSDSKSPIGCLNSISDQRSDETGRAEATFSGGSGGLPEIDETVGRFASAANADKSFKAIKKAVDACGSFSTQYSGALLSGQVSPLDFPDLGGDAQQAYRLVGTISGTQISAVIVLVHKGDLDLGFVYLDSSTVSTGAVEPLVKKAVAKL